MPTYRALLAAVIQPLRNESCASNEEQVMYQPVSDDSLDCHRRTQVSKEKRYINGVEMSSVVVKDGTQFLMQENRQTDGQYSVVRRTLRWGFQFSGGRGPALKWIPALKWSLGRSGQPIGVS